MTGTAGGYAYLTVNAFNPWALIGIRRRRVAGGGDDLVVGHACRSSGPSRRWPSGPRCSSCGLLWGNVPRRASRDDRWTILVAAAFLAAAFFVLPTRVHERYLFPVFAFLPLLAVAQRRWLVALLLLAAARFINLHAVLTNPLYGTANVVALPLGDLVPQRRDA